jgi:hypothetical protein
MNLILEAEEKTRRKFEDSLKSRLGELQLPRGFAVKYREDDPPQLPPADSPPA